MRNDSEIIKRSWITRKQNDPTLGDKMAIRGMSNVSVVSVSDVPLTRAERMLQNLVSAVYKLPKGRGLKVLYTGRYTDPPSMQRVLISFGRLMGKPITTRVRYHGKEPFIYVFKRTDLTKRRNGFETR